MTASTASLTLSRKLRFAQIVVFQQVLHSGSIVRAAQALNMTQSAVTKVIHELETNLGGQLLVRGNRGVAPTEFGELVARRAKTLLAELRHMTDEINAFREGTSGQVLIGTLISASAVLLPRAIQLLKQQAPGVIVTLRVAQMDQLLQALVVGELDLVVGRMPEDVTWRTRTPQLRAEKLHREPLAVVAGVGHPLASSASITLQALSAYPWILPTRDSSLRQIAERMFYKAGLPLPANVVESLSVLTNVALMFDQKTIGLMPRSAAKQFVETGSLAMIPLMDAPAFGDIGLFAAADTLPVRTVELFKDCLRAAAAELG